MVHEKVEGLWTRVMPWVVALVLQVALTPVLLGQPIRISFADPVVPLVLLALFFVAWRQNGLRTALDHVFPPWLLIFWALIATGWLTVALLHGRAEIGDWSGWALRNKYIGWYVLLFFLFAGFVCVRLVAGFVARFFVAFVCIAGLCAAATLVAFVLTQWVIVPKGFLFGPDARAVGLIGNANAFGFLIALGLAIQLSGLLRIPGPDWLRWVLPAVMLAAMVLTGSRSSWLTFAAGVAVFSLYRHLDWRALLVAIVAGTLIATAIGTIEPQQGDVVGAKVPTEIYVSVDDLFDASQHGVSQRMDQMRLGIDLWLSDPVLGTGLGRYLVLERELGLLVPQQIHNTYLWLLAETGVVGFLLVVCFFLFVAGRLHRATHADPLLMIGVVTLLMFGFMALFQEALYQRHIWFLTGAMLAIVTVPRDRIVDS